MRLPLPFAAALATLLLLPLRASAAASSPESTGPHRASSEVLLVAAGPAEVNATVCLPDEGGPYPAIAIAGGATDGRAVLADLCLHLATHGFVVIVPDLGVANTDAVSLGGTLRDVLAFLTRESTREGSRFQGRIAARFRAVVGVNTGGMGALAAAAADPTLSAAVLLDPTDLNGQSRTLAAEVKKVPVVAIRAEPHLCNGNDSFATVIPAMAGPHSSFVVTTSNACDVQSPASQLCQTSCGPVHLVAPRWFRRYATASLLWLVGCDASMRGWVDGALRQGQADDNTLKRLESTAFPAQCGPQVEPDAGPPPDGGAVETNIWGCSTAPAWPEPWLLLALASPLLPLLLRRRA